ncbi:MAG: hypothetical protein V7629_06965 [Motiliproteus sp.]
MATQVSTQIKVSEDGRYVIVTQSGPLSPADIKHARAESLPLYSHCDRALVDYRLVDLSDLRLVDLSTLAAEFKQDVPKCLRLAVVKTAGTDDSNFTYLMNECCVNGVKTCVFDEMEAAKNWLLGG